MNKKNVIFSCMLGLLISSTGYSELNEEKKKELSNLVLGAIQECRQIQKDMTDTFNQKYKLKVTALSSKKTAAKKALDAANESINHQIKLIEEIEENTFYERKGVLRSFSSDEKMNDFNHDITLMKSICKQDKEEFTASMK